MVDAWTADLGAQHRDFQVLAFSPLDLATVCLAVTTCVDDLCRKILVESPEDANQKVRRSNQALDAALAAEGMAENTGKQEHVAFFGSKHKYRYNRRIFHKQLLPGKAVPFAKYLGGFQTHDFSPAHGA